MRKRPSGCLFTARKRSLRRLCFHRCLSVHGGGGSLSREGGLCPGGRGVSVQEGGGSLSREEGGLCPRGGRLCLGGLCPWGSLSTGCLFRGESLSGRVSVQGGSLFRGVSVGGGSCLCDSLLVTFLLSWSVIMSVSGERNSIGPADMVKWSSIDGTKKLDGTQKKEQTGFVQWSCVQKSFFRLRVLCAEFAMDQSQFKGYIYCLPGFLFCSFWESLCNG